MATGTIHAAKFDKSKRLQRTLAVLADHQPHTTWQIAQRTQSVAVHTDIAELRANGNIIESQRLGRTSDGRMIHAYKLVCRA